MLEATVPGASGVWRRHCQMIWFDRALNVTVTAGFGICQLSIAYSWTGDNFGSAADLLLLARLHRPILHYPFCLLKAVTLSEIDRFSAHLRFRKGSLTTVTFTVHVVDWLTHWLTLLVDSDYLRLSLSSQHSMIQCSSFVGSSFA